MVNRCQGWVLLRPYSMANRSGDTSTSLISRLVMFDGRNTPSIQSMNLFSVNRSYKAPTALTYLDSPGTAPSVPEKRTQKATGARPSTIDRIRSGSDLPQRHV